MGRAHLLRSCAAVAAVVGGVAWVVKGGAILVGLDQPPLLLDVGVAAFPVTLVCLAASAHRRASLVLGVVSLVAGWLALATEVAGRAQGPTILVSSLALVLGLALLGGEDPERRAARALGLLTVPVLLVGGLLALVAEPLIEVSTVVLGLAWLVLGLALVGGRYARALRGFRGLGRTTSTGHGA
ncbi:hypothetical protein [Nocardioides sediminis]|uniref:hypothetical protein n=1 Tax=Nocardioides sediminis TaxID=433648 RepID=UPI000D3232A3|nr:hypothetical protein [Nocardioides sediminis]